MGRAQLPIRIYTLAKELKIDNKKLVDVCERAGIRGKGSALASLSDEELATLKAYMAGGRAGAARPGAAPAGRPAADAAAPSQGFRREDYIAPGSGAVGSKVPVLSPKADKPAGKKKPAEEVSPKGAEKEKEKEREKQPALKLAPLPTAVRPPAKSKEPAPQRPDIKLPADAIRATRRGEQAAFRAHPQARREAGEGGGCEEGPDAETGRRWSSGAWFLARGCPRRPRAAASRPASPSPSWRRRKKGPPLSADGSSGN